MCNHWLQALKVEAAVAPEADSFADAQAQVVYQRAKAQRAQAEYERLKDIFAQAEMAAVAAEQEGQQIRAEMQAQQQAKAQQQQTQQQAQQQQAQAQQQQAAAELQSPCDRPQQPSSLLVVGEELCADSINEVQVAPAQATPQPA